MFIAVRKLYVRMRNWGIGNGEFLESDDRHVKRGTRPGVALNELASDAGRSCQQVPADSHVE